MKRIRALLTKYREQVLYLIFGVGTTAVNLIVYYILSELMGVDVGVATAVGWVLSVVFAYVTNRIWVFESRANGLGPVLREAASFALSRVATGLTDEGVILLFVKHMGLPNMPVKIASNVLVIVLNYLLSKNIVFRKKS